MFSIHVGIDRGILVCLITAFNFKILRRPNFMLSHSHGGSWKVLRPQSVCSILSVFLGTISIFRGCNLQESITSYSRRLCTQSLSDCLSSSHFQGVHFHTIPFFALSSTTKHNYCSEGPNYAPFEYSMVFFM